MAERTASSEPGAFDFAPAMKMYVQNMERWQADFERLMQNTGRAAPQTVEQPAAVSASPDIAFADYQKIGQAALICVMQQQIELARFASQRMASYMELPRKLACCHGPADLGEVEFDFMRRTAVDYAREAAALMQPVHDMVVALSPEQAGPGGGNGQ